MDNKVIAIIVLLAFCILATLYISVDALDKSEKLSLEVKSMPTAREYLTISPETLTAAYDNGYIDGANTVSIMMGKNEYSYNKLLVQKTVDSLKFLDFAKKLIR